LLLPKLYTHKLILSIEDKLEKHQNVVDFKQSLLQLKKDNSLERWQKSLLRKQRMKAIILKKTLHV